jgi:hypothetical protein
MIKITNTSQNYIVTNENEDFSINMNVTVSKENTGSISASGSFNTLDGQYAGNFGYSEDSEGKISQNIYDVAKANKVALEALLDETIDGFNANVNDNE